MYASTKLGAEGTFFTGYSQLVHRLRRDGSGGRGEMGRIRQGGLGGRDGSWGFVFAPFHGMAGEHNLLFSADPALHGAAAEIVALAGRLVSRSGDNGGF